MVMMVCVFNGLVSWSASSCSSRTACVNGLIQPCITALRYKGSRFRVVGTPGLVDGDMKVGQSVDDDGTRTS
jgi:hypothetical protein